MGACLDGVAALDRLPVSLSNMCMKQCSFTCVSLSVFALYVAVLAQTLVTLVFPGGLGGFDYDTPMPNGKLPKVYAPLWKEDTMMDVAFYLSSSSKPIDGKPLETILKPGYQNDHAALSKKHHFVFQQENIPFRYDDAAVVKKQLNLTKSSVSQKLWRQIIKGKTYLHGIVHRHGYSPNSRSKNYNPHFVKHYTFFMGRKREYAKTPKQHRIFTLSQMDVFSIFTSTHAGDESSFLCGDPKLSIEPPSFFENGTGLLVENERKPHWTPSLSFRIVADWTRYPENQVPALIAYKMRVNGYNYVPFTFVDSVGLTSDKYIPLNNTVTTLPLEITFEPSGVGRWQLGLQMEESFKILHQSMGARDKESDEMRSLITETHPTLLVVTLVVTLLHTLFDVLAFKSDIDFWRKLKSKRGLSTRSQVTSLICQIVVIAYLQHEKGSLLILIPSVIGVLLQVWKVQKMLCSKSLMENRLEERINADASAKARSDSPSDTGAQRAKGKASASKKKHDGKEVEKLQKKLREEKEAVKRTKYFDNMAGIYLGEILYPLVVGSIIHSALCRGHTSYYSWVISSAVYAVYTFGFIIMTPQLFINYKLKSVAHLPWKFFMYRALNTFIDDLFAFIIKMPTAHRLSCFRDDIVFFIFLYQRWIYPVDYARVSIGVDGEEADEDSEMTKLTASKVDPKSLRSGDPGKEQRMSKAKKAE